MSCEKNWDLLVRLRTISMVPLQAPILKQDKNQVNIDKSTCNTIIAV